MIRAVLSCTVIPAHKMRYEVPVTFHTITFFLVLYITVHYCSSLGREECANPWTRVVRCSIGLVRVDLIRS